MTSRCLSWKSELVWVKLNKTETIKDPTLSAT